MQYIEQWSKYTFSGCNNLFIFWSFQCTTVSFFTLSNYNCENGQQLCFHGYIYNKGSMRKVGYVYRYQQPFNKFHIKKEFWALQLSLGNRQEKTMLPYYECTLIRWDNELKSNRYWNSFCAKDRTGRWYSKTTDL